MRRAAKQNGVWSRTERSGIEEETEHSGERACSGEARADCGRGAACLLAHLSVLNLYVVSATGSAPSHPPWSHPPGPRRRRTENPRRAPAPERDEKDEDSARSGERERERGRERRSPGHTGRDISSQGELRSRNRVKRVGQTDDRRRASTALRTQKPRF